MEPLPLKNQQYDELLDHVRDFPEFLRFESRAKSRKPKKRTLNTTIVPHENDVLMGRGGRNNQHEGNEKLREFARRVKDEYQSASKREKSHLSRELVRKVRSLNPPGRFLKRKSISNEWVDVGDKIAREKASQVLRDACASNNSPTTSPTNTDSLAPSENPDYSPVPIPQSQSMPTPVPTTPLPHHLYLPQQPYSAPIYSAFIPPRPPAFPQSLPPPPPSLPQCAHPCLHPPTPVLNYRAAAFSPQSTVHPLRKRRKFNQHTEECAGFSAPTDTQWCSTVQEPFNKETMKNSDGIGQHKYECDDMTALNSVLYQEELPDSETEYERFQSEYNFKK